MIFGCAGLLSGLFAESTAAQMCTDPIRGDIGCLGATTDRVLFGDGDDFTSACAGTDTTHPDHT